MRPVLSVTEFWVLIILNTVFAALYLVYGLLRYRSKKGGEQEMEVGAPEGVVVKAFLIVICPVIMPLFLGLGKLFHVLFFHRDVDLADVIFSKERVRTFAYADEEREMNMAPLEESIAVSDNASLRTLMLNVVRGDIGKSLRSISLALNGEDSETAHYAASVLCEELNNFRTNVQKLYVEIKKENEKFFSYVDTLLPYMNDVLEQRVFGDIEQEKFVLQMEEVCELFYEKDKALMASMHYEWICARLLEIRSFGLCEKWALRSAEEYPGMLSAYTSRLKLYFTMQDREKFFVVLNELKASEVVIDQETLELIRIFT